MSFFSDLFGSGYQNAAQAQIQGLQSAQKDETPYYNQATQNTTNYGSAALAPYTGLVSTGNQGTTALGNALGLNGASGNASALSTLQNTPGYQFALQQGLQAVDRGSAAKGLGTSGNALNAEDQYAQGLASQTYNNYVSQLQPYLGVAENAAQGVANTNLTTGSNLASENLGQGNYVSNIQTGIGNANAAADTAAQNAENSFINGAVNAVGNIGGALLGKMPVKTS